MQQPVRQAAIHTGTSTRIIHIPMKFLQPCIKVAAAFSSTTTTTTRRTTTRTTTRATIPLRQSHGIHGVTNHNSIRTSQLSFASSSTCSIYQTFAQNDISLSPTIAPAFSFPFPYPCTRLFSTKSDITNDDNTSTNDHLSIHMEQETKPQTQQQQEFASSYHAPVMYKECIDALLKKSHLYVKKHRNKYKKKIEKECDDNDGSAVIVEEDDGNVHRPRVFIDGTLGGGGHSQCLLESLSPGDVVIGCDVDPSALATASMRLKDYIVKPRSNHNDGDGHDDGDGNEEETMVVDVEHDKPIFIPLNSNFKDLEQHVKVLKHPITGKLLVYQNESSDDDDDDNDNDANNVSGDSDHGQMFVGVDGILLDLGVSSHQIDNAERGFAFMKDGPLDMRMFGGKWMNYDNLSLSSSASASSRKEQNSSDGIDSDESLSYQEYVNNLNMSRNRGGLTAADICNEFAEEDISRILKKYGDEPRARKIAQSIVALRPLKTTGDLKNAVAMVTPEFVKKNRRMGRTATLARVFQSLRIVVNDEEGVLREAFEEMAPSLVAKGGRLVILTYHSMEDRAAKRVIRDGSVNGRKQSIERDLYGNIMKTKNSSPWRALGKMQRATEEEVKLNSRARSASLRVAEKI